MAISGLRVGSSQEVDEEEKDQKTDTKANQAGWEGDRYINTYGFGILVAWVR